jgi:hypothetical protein
VLVDAKVKKNQCGPADSANRLPFFRLECCDGRPKGTDPDPIHACEVSHNPA